MMPLVDGHEEISIEKSNEHIHTLTNDKLNRFMLMTVVVGLIMIATLGYESIRTQFVVNAAHDEIVNRAAQAAAQRAVQCAYTSKFVSAVHKFEANQAIADQLQQKETPAFNQARLYAFDTLFHDLDALGSNSCKEKSQ
jgi:hypothetical protein